jgi:type II secretory pathway pseudopilin PulG
MKNKLKGFTLIETVLYIGLFSIILLMVISFMLMTQESASNTKSTESLYDTSQFITQHINYTFENASSVDEINSNFEIESGKLTLLVDTLTKVYDIQNQQLYYDGVPISPPHITVEKFYLTPIYKGTDITAVRITILLRDKKNTNRTEEINLLSTFR